MAQPVLLPYTSAITNIKLPTTVEIRACDHVLHERHAAKIVAISDEVVVKFGGGVTEAEGQALVYLERHVPQIPAPRLYSMYHDSDQLFLVMQRIPGTQLEQLWPSLTNAEKDNLSEQLGVIFTSLRATPCPVPNLFSSVDGGSIQRYLFYDQSGEQQNMGPFYGEVSFVKGLIGNLRAYRERNGRPAQKADFYEKHLPNVLRGHRAVLTHGDVQKRNIIVTERSDSSPGSEARARQFDVTLVDWEMAGWLPDYWEYFCASLMFLLVGWDGEDDWCWQAGRFLPVFLAETAVMREFDKDMQ